MQISSQHALAAMLLVVSGCGGSGGGSSMPTPTTPTQVTLALQFEPATDRNVDVRIRINTDSGVVPEIGMLSLTSDFGALGLLSEQIPPVQVANEIHFSALLTPDDTDATGDIWTGEIAITARYQDSTQRINSAITRSVLVLSDKLPGIGQPEVVPGLVNTRGVEDSPEVSTDGQWLSVGTYMPIDFGYCLVKGRSYTEPACNNNFYDTTGVERPGLFGAERIIDAQTIDHAIPAINYDPEFGQLATPPTASYLFRRQADGSYGEPTVLGILIFPSLAISNASFQIWM